MAFDIGKYNGDFRAFVDFASVAARRSRFSPVTPSCGKKGRGAMR